MVEPVVLLVDDDRDTLELYQLVLQLAGQRTHTATTAAQAVRLAVDLRPSVIVMDWRLPDGEGLDLLKALHGHGRTRRIPRLAVTGMSLSGKVIAQARALGCVEVITKPVAPDELVGSINRALAGADARRLRAAATRIWREAVRLQVATAGQAIQGIGQRLLTRPAAGLNRDVAVILADDNGRYIAANESAASLTGYATDQLTRLSVWDLTPMPSSAVGRQLWAEFIRQGRQEGEYLVRHRSGRAVPARYVALANIAPGVHLSALSRVGGEAFAA